MIKTESPILWLSVCYTSAPVWGATPLHVFELHQTIVTTSAPVWGATKTINDYYYGLKLLLARPHGARCVFSVVITNCHVTTSAPAWGAMSLTVSACLIQKLLLARPHGARWYCLINLGNTASIAVFARTSCSSSLLYFRPLINPCCH